MFHGADQKRGIGGKSAFFRGEIRFFAIYPDRWRHRSWKRTHLQTFEGIPFRRDLLLQFRREGFDQFLIRWRAVCDAAEAEENTEPCRTRMETFERSAAMMMPNKRGFSIK